MKYPPGHKKYLPPRRSWFEKKVLGFDLQPVEPLPLSGWLMYGVIYALILIPVFFFS